MKKLLISALALTVSFGAMAQSKEELKAIKEQQKAITAILKDAEKLGKVAEDAMGQIDQTKTPDFAGARSKVAEAMANPQAKTMLGDINRVAGDIEYIGSCNSGSRGTKKEGHGPAASRYTECKLSEVGALMLEDINKNCVPMRPNYDESEQEPAYLPSKFPNILCNGNSGIAVGISSGLLPHNYNEVADAISYYIDNQNCSTADLMKFIKGPDFPTGGQIINGEELLAAYETEGSDCDCVETNDCVSLYEFSCFVHNFFILVVIQR